MSVVYVVCTLYTLTYTLTLCVYTASTWSAVYTLKHYLKRITFSIKVLWKCFTYLLWVHVEALHPCTVFWSVLHLCTVSKCFTYLLWVSVYYMLRHCIHVLYFEHCIYLKCSVHSQTSTWSTSLFHLQSSNRSEYPRTRLPAAPKYYLWLT